MINHLCVADSGYHHLMVEEENGAARESFFNPIDVTLSHTSGQFRFSLPGQHLTDEYRRKISGFFYNEPCIYNHVVVGHAATLFEVMKHPPEAFLPGGKKTLMTVKPASVAVQPTYRGRHVRRQSIAGSLPTSSAVLLTAPTKIRGTSPLPPPLSARPRFTGGIEIPEIEFTSENEKRLTYQLVFQTLKYQKFLQDMLHDCKFFDQHPEAMYEYNDETINKIVRPEVHRSDSRPNSDNMTTFVSVSPNSEYDNGAMDADSQMASAQL